MVKHSGTIIFTPNLNHLKKGGRITPAVAMLGNMLKLVPVMELNSELGGKIDTLGKVRTTRKACKMLADRVVERGANAKDYTFAIEDVLAPEEAQRVRDYLEEQLGPWSSYHERVTKCCRCSYGNWWYRNPIHQKSRRVGSR